MTTSVTSRGGPALDDTALRLRRARRQGGVVVLLLAGAAWLALAAWDLSPYGRFLDHDELAETGMSMPALTAVFLGGWVLMLAAMMFPTTHALVQTFTPVARRHGSHRRLLAALLVGYVAAWSAVGLIALAGDLGIHATVEAWHWLEHRTWLLGAASLFFAGAYQFSPIKNRCLQVCRSPRTFVMGHWRGRNPTLEAFLLGVDHGRYCIGCCAGLMLLMFAVGMGNLGVMFALATVMAAEKLWSGGDRLAGPLGIALLLAAAGVVVLH